MVQRYYVKLAVMKDVPTMSLKEEYVGNMVPSKSGRNAITKDVPIMLRKEGCVSDTGRKVLVHFASMRVTQLLRRRRRRRVPKVGLKH